MQELRYASIACTFMVIVLLLLGGLFVSSSFWTAVILGLGVGEVVTRGLALLGVAAALMWQMRWLFQDLRAAHAARRNGEQ